MEYEHVTFKCTFGSKRASRGAGFRNRGFKSTSCQSVITVRRKSNIYRITKYQTVHNHPCTASFMSIDVSRRRLSPQEMAVIQPSSQHSEPKKSGCCTAGSSRVHKKVGHFASK
ncbi:unnamed protein product [Trichobilharzia szidati]|nr:unnamed protein product [Trichobilharzia szidati]